MQVIQLAFSGMCLVPPAGCPRAIYLLMVDCWSVHDSTAKTVPLHTTTFLNSSNFALMHMLLFIIIGTPGIHRDPSLTASLGISPSPTVLFSTGVTKTRTPPPCRLVCWGHLYKRAGNFTEICSYSTVVIPAHLWLPHKDHPLLSHTCNDHRPHSYPTRTRSYTHELTYTLGVATKCSS